MAGSDRSRGRCRSSSRLRQRGLVEPAPAANRTGGCTQIGESEVTRNLEQSEREDRILSEIVVDAYGETERAMSWYYYLEEKLVFPFKARCCRVRSTSPLAV